VKVKANIKENFKNSPFGSSKKTTSPRGETSQTKLKNGWMSFLNCYQNSQIKTPKKIKKGSHSTISEVVY